jgi:hypothetical protein
MDKLNLNDWNLVYQGGHHNVYCNGEKHFKTGGGFCNIGNHTKEFHVILAQYYAERLADRMNCSFEEMFYTKCDCSHYAKTS